MGSFGGFCTAILQQPQSYPQQAKDIQRATGLRERLMSDHRPSTQLGRKAHVLGELEDAPENGSRLAYVFIMKGWLVHATQPLKRAPRAPERDSSEASIKTMPVGLANWTGSSFTGWLACLFSLLFAYKLKNKLPTHCYHRDSPTLEVSCYIGLLEGPTRALGSVLGRSRVNTLLRLPQFAQRQDTPVPQCLTMQFMAKWLCWVWSSMAWGWLVPISV